MASFGSTGLVCVALLAGAAYGGASCEERSPKPELGSEARRDPAPAGGGEAWRATTRVPAAGARGWVSVREEVRLDASGRLLFADTRVTDDAGSPEVHVTCDAAGGRIVVERAGRRVELAVSGAEPWILAPVRGPSGEVIATPLVAWVTWRASQRAEWLRLIEPLEQTTWVVPRDQYVVGTTVIVGDEGVEVDDRFVREIAIGGVELARNGAGAAFRFRGG
jgi:hypothetical protein